MKKSLLIIVMFLSGCGYHYGHGYARPYNYDYQQYYRYYNTYPRYDQWDYDNQRFKPTFPPQYNGYIPKDYGNHKDYPNFNAKRKRREIQDNWNKLNPRRVPTERYPNAKPAIKFRR